MQLPKVRLPSPKWIEPFCKGCLSNPGTVSVANIGRLNGDIGPKHARRRLRCPSGYWVSRGMLSQDTRCGILFAKTVVGCFTCLWEIQFRQVLSNAEKSPPRVGYCGKGDRGDDIYRKQRLRLQGKLCYSACENNFSLILPPCRKLRLQALSL